MAHATQPPRSLTGSARVRQRKRADSAFILWGILATALGLIVLSAVVLVLLHDGGARLNWDFLTSFPSRKPQAAGLIAALIGSLLVIITTAVIAIPLGIAAAIYLEEYAPKSALKDAVEIAVNNLAAVPSIVYGLLALGLFVYQLHLGRSIATAGLTLALLILPIIIVATREALRSTPATIREAALALGATKWQATQDHVLPAAMPGVVTGIIIGLSRAMGESAPLITIGALSFVAFLPVSLPQEPQYLQIGRYDAQQTLQNPGETVSVRVPRGGVAILPDGSERAIAPGSADLPTGSQVRTTLGLAGAAASWSPSSWLGESFSVLPIQMFNWTSRPNPAFRANAAAAGLALLAITLLLNGGAVWLRYRLRRSLRW